MHVFVSVRGSSIYYLLFIITIVIYSAAFHPLIGRFRASNRTHNDANGVGVVIILPDRFVENFVR